MIFQAMKALRRAVLRRVGNGAFSVARTWCLLLLLACLLLLMDVRLFWEQERASSPTPSLPHLSLQERLKDGYSHSINQALHLHEKRSSSMPKQKRVTSANEGAKQSLNIQDLLFDIDEKGEKEGEGVRALPAANMEGRKEEEKRELDRIPSAELTKGVSRETENLLRYSKALKLEPNSKWIVLDVTSGKCEEVKGAPSGWRILAVGEATTLKGCSPPSCIYLPAELNSKLRGNDNKTGSPQRNLLPLTFQKNLAYLATISHKAQYVLDAHCATNLKKSVQTLLFLPRHDHGPMYNETLLFNAYAHFGAWAAVPRALIGGDDADARAHARGRGGNSWIYYVREFDGNVLVKHGVTDRGSDVSSLDGEKRNGGGKVAGMRFDPSTPPVFLGQGSFSPAVPLASLYRGTSLWALSLPCNDTSTSSSTLRCHVLRQLLQQRLFRELDAFSGFYQLDPASYFIRNFTNPATTDVEKLALNLHSWRCRPRFKFFDCVDDLADHLYAKRAVSEGEFTHLKSWVGVLRKVNFPEPGRVSSPWRGVRKTSEVRVTLGSAQVRLESGGAREEALVKNTFVDRLAGQCNMSRRNEWFPAAQWRKPLIDDIVLIIVFNWNVFFWNNLPFTETMHRPFFKHIFYCVPNMDELIVEDKEGVLRHVSFVEGLSDTWFFMYECVTIVAKMNIQGVRGYLQIGDDTLTNSWKYVRAPRDTMWIPHGFSTMRVDEASHNWGWYWWKKSRGRPAVLQALADLEDLSGMTPDQLLKLDPNYSKLRAQAKPVDSFKRTYDSGKDAFPRMRPKLPGSEAWEAVTRQEAVKFLENYYKANKLSGRVRHRALDFFYIPQVLADGWVKFTHHFLRRNVLIELAVPTIHYGLAPRSNVKYVSASSVWRTDRNSSYSFYDDQIYFLHPFKMKAHMEQKESRQFFCQEYMRILFSELKGLV